MSTWIWGLVLVGAVWLAHWGAEHLADPLKQLRRQWGLTQVAGGAFVGLAAASPEIGINATSAYRGVSDIGLGAMLGSNIVAIPLMVSVAYLATRKARLGAQDGADTSADGDNSEGSEAHQQHRQQRLLRVKREAVSVLALPYLGILALVALLTLPAGWRGLQPIDGWIMLGAYLVFLAQAVVRGRREGQQVDWTKREIGLALAGLLALAVGAYFTVRSTEAIVSALGISRIVGGLFITGTMAAAPEVFATWSLARSGQVTSAITSVVADHAVTMTVAFLPLALVTVPIGDLLLYSVNLGFVALVGALYAGFIHRGAQEHGFSRWEVIALDSTYAIYVIVMLVGVLNVI